MMVRIFGSLDCPVCQIIKKHCENQSFFRWEFVDANADETQALCDEHNVDILPHVQIIDDKSKVVWQEASQKLTYSTVVHKLAKFA